MQQFQLGIALRRVLPDRDKEGNRVWMVREEHNTPYNFRPGRWADFWLCTKMDLKYASPLLESDFGQEGPIELNSDGTVTITGPTYKGKYIGYDPASLFQAPGRLVFYSEDHSKKQEEAIQQNTPRFMAGYICRGLGMADLPFRLNASDRDSVITKSEETYPKSYALLSWGEMEFPDKTIERPVITSIRCQVRQ